jgi:hypothetical protein
MAAYDDSKLLNLLQLVRDDVVRPFVLTLNIVKLYFEVGCVFFELVDFGFEFNGVTFGRMKFQFAKRARAGRSASAVATIAILITVVIIIVVVIAVDLLGLCSIQKKVACIVGRCRNGSRPLEHAAQAGL